MEITELLNYSWTLVIPLMLKLMQAFQSSHFSHVKSKREGLSLLKDAIGDDINNLSPERKFILEETLSQYYKRNLSHAEFLFT